MSNDLAVVLGLMEDRAMVGEARREEVRALFQMTASVPEAYRRMKELQRKDPGVAKRVRTWRTGKLGTIYASGKEGSFMSVAWSPDGRYVAIANWYERVRIVEAATQRVLRVLNGNLNSQPRHPWRIRVAWSPDGRRIGLVSNCVRVWDARSGELLHVTDGHSGITWSPDGQRFATLDRPTGIIVRDSQNGSIVQKIPAHRSPILAWSPDGKFLATGSIDNLVQIWGRVSDQPWGEEGRLLRSARTEGDVMSLSWNPDGQSLAYATRYGITQTLSLDGAKEPLPKMRGNLVAWSPNDRWLATVVCNSSLLSIYDTQTRAEVSFSLEPKKIAEPEKTAQSERSIHDFAWSPDSRQLATVRFSAVTFWDVARFLE